MFRLIREMVNVTPESRQTNISNAIEYALKVIRKKAIIFLISDFIDPHYHQALKTLNRKHEVVPIVIEDPKELVLPKSGLVTLEDDETGEQVVINTYSNDIRMRFRNIVLARRLERNRSFKSMKLRPITINTEKPFWDIVVSYFQTKRLK